MTDITKLAQILKAAAIDAKELAIIARYSKGRAAAEKFYALANPNNVIALVEALEKAQQERDNWRTSFDNERFRADKLKAHIDDIEPIRAAAEKLVRCKGRYHSEKNYRALAALFGVNTPDLQPLDGEPRTVTDWIEHDGKWRPDSLSTDELVYLKTRKQELKIPYPAGKVMGWMHTGGDMDVMAYKLASSQARTVTVKLTDINEYLAEVHDKTLNRAFRLLAEGVRAGDVAAMRAAGIKVETE